jgi:hypothetical protein
MGTPRKMLLNGPNISVNTELVDYGTIKKNSERLRTFTITNTGNEPLVIQGCAGNCGCTVPECPKEPIMPGKSATISINYATERVGEFSKNVTITTNAVNEPNKVIKVSGTVIE